MLKKFTVRLQRLTYADVEVWAESEDKVRAEIDEDSLDRDSYGAGDWEIVDCKEFKVETDMDIIYPYMLDMLKDDGYLFMTDADELSIETLALQCYQEMNNVEDQNYPVWYLMVAETIANENKVI